MSEARELQANDPGRRLPARAIRARELQAADNAKALHHVAGCTCSEHRVEERERVKKGNFINVKLTIPQAQALVEAGEEWPDFTDMSGHQIRASKRGAKTLRTALLAIGREPTWV